MADAGLFSSHPWSWKKLAKKHLKYKIQLIPHQRQQSISNVHQNRVISMTL
ncbi:hypothetical protein ACVFZR_07575 [Lacticaseibacillus paracasei]